MTYNRAFQTFLDNESFLQIKFLPRNVSKQEAALFEEELSTTY